MNALVDALARSRQRRELNRSAPFRWLWDRWWCGFCYGAGRALGDSRRESMGIARRCWKAAKRRADRKSDD